MLHYRNLVEREGVALELNAVGHGLNDVVLLYVVLAFVNLTEYVLDVLVRCCREESQTAGVYAKDRYLLAAYAACRTQERTVASEAYGYVGAELLAIDELCGLWNVNTLRQQELIERLVYAERVAISCYGAEQLSYAS